MWGRGRRVEWRERAATGSARSARVATVIPVDGHRAGMTVVVDISCPACGEQQAVHKVGLGRYACDECGHDFDHADVEP